MKILILIGLAALALPHLGGAAKTHDETVFLFENRKVVLAVPEGFGFSSSKDDRGVLNVKIADRKEQAALQLTFLPDPDSHFASGWNRREFMNDQFRTYVAGSVEKAMQFNELEPHQGAGTYCVFTDTALVGKSKLPPGEFLNSTAGVKAWPGVVTVFVLFSNDTTSKDYKALMEMLRDSVQEEAPPLK